VRDKVRVGYWVAMKLDITESNAGAYNLLDMSREKIKYTKRLGLELGLEAFYRYTKLRYY
jgi:hypothetical protein